MDSLILDAITKWKIESTNEPLIIGLNGPQGIGKTSFCRKISSTLENTSIICVDDFYHKHSVLLEIASDYPSNPLLQKRGYPPTIDLKLMLECVISIKNSIKTIVPIFDKSKFNGAGDRDIQTRVIHKPSILIIEGWCFGFRRIPDLKKDKHINEINESFSEFEHIYNLVDKFVLLEAADIDFVYDWRWQQEKDNNQGMTFNETKNFIDKYMVGYKIYSPGLRDRMLDLNKEILQIKIAKDRSVKV